LEALGAHEEIERDLLEENARLRRLVGFKSRAKWPMVPAEVIGRHLGPWSRGLLIDKGVRDGVRSGMAVVTPTGLVGRIAEAGPSLSQVILLTDPHFRVMARLSANQLPGLVMGGPTGVCVVTYLPLDEVIPPGQTVLTTGGASFSPAGIPVGVIQKVWKDASGMHQTARIEPFVRLGGIQEVGVVEWRAERE